MFYQFITNPIVLSAFFASFIAQMIKTLLDWKRNQHFHWQSMFRGAGMPSSHTATVVALTLSVWLVEGLGTIFIITLVYAVIVVRDVIGDKVFAVHQENIINTIFQQISRHEKVEWTHLTGHSFTEVIAGLVLGIAVTASVFYVLPLITL